MFKTVGIENTMTLVHLTRISAADITNATLTYSNAAWLKLNIGLMRAGLPTVHILEVLTKVTKLFLFNLF